VVPPVELALMAARERSDASDSVKAWSSRWVRDVFLAALVASAVPRVRFHDLRHMAATRLPSKGCIPMDRRWGEMSDGVSFPRRLCGFQWRGRMGVEPTGAGSTDAHTVLKIGARRSAPFMPVQIPHGYAVFVPQPFEAVRGRSAALLSDRCQLRHERWR
jgi:hypothetical protein